MPIVDQSLQHTLINSSFKKKNKRSQILNCRCFYLNFLQIASKFIYRNFSTIETYIRFKKDLINAVDFLENMLDCRISKADLNNPSINNYYQFIYDQIKIKTKEMIPMEEIGNFCILNDQFSTKFFQYTPFNSYSWFFSDGPIAILSLNTYNFFYNHDLKLLFQSIQLEIDLLAASGYTLVFCVSNDGHGTDFILNLIRENTFSEIHYNILSSSDYCKAEAFFEKFYEKFKQSLQEFKGYFYFYANYLNQDRRIPKDIKKIPRINFISFSDYFDKIFDNIKFSEIDPFPFCRNGFNSKYLQIRLSNVPLYDSENEENSLVPCQVSGISIGFVSSDDFLVFNRKRIPILFQDDSQNGRYFRKFVYFDDIHKMRPDLYTKNQISLAKVKNKTLKKVKQIERKIKSKIVERKDKELINDKIFSLFKSQKIKNSLEYVAYAYSYSKYKEGQIFFAHTTQIYTAYEALKNFILKKTNRKGVVFQVETGEGKTYIVCLIAAALAKLNKTVHITSSNIKLSIRDYEESYKFFQLLQIETALLLHSNKLPSFVQKMYNIDYNMKLNLEDNQAKDISENQNENTDENNTFFKGNAENYLKNNAQNTEKKMIECYPIKYYDKDLFNNSSKMNFSVCGLSEEKKESDNKADVIYSTFINFECLYLKMVELYPGSVEPYFKDCGLLIDEADSILIDEIANGTIISRSMKSNSTEILKFVYDQYKLGKKCHETYELVNNNKKWTIGRKLKEKYIKQMYEEIEIVHKPEYSNGKKYSIEQIVVKNKKKKNQILKDVINLASNIAKDIVQNFVTEFTKDVKDAESDDKDNDGDNDDDDDDEENEEEEELNESPTVFNYIVPFSYDKNGILEPSKEFGGFIQQFIAIKESVDNNVKNMIVNDISMSYLYISHPIFVKLYGKVCGFTGTVGSKADKKLLRNEYCLDIIKVPRHNPNLNVEFPKIICKNIGERNKRIVQEIIEFHKRGNPVLAIFQDLKEIETIDFLIRSRGISSINIFNGKDDILKPDEIAGLNGAVSLGTNVCGRGTDIIAKGKPLHVIVSYFSSNTRAMGQAFGRTARQGRKGTYRIICTEEQFFSPIYVLENVNESMREFQIKNLRQKEYVDHFKSKRKWIFSNYIKEQSIDNDSLKTMRKAKINVNRIVAYKYVFPICMTKKAFLTIQKQKIFSLFNCPNSQFTWKLFQRYIREMILESWSLMINKLDQKYKNKVKGDIYDAELVENRKQLYKLLSNFLPDSDFGVVPTFMHIFKDVIKEYEKKVFIGFTKMAKPLIEFNQSSFFLCKVGFRPYALLSESGARIYSKNFKKMNFIKDPELKYERRTMKKHIFTRASITEKIDEIFNQIFIKVNEILGTKTFLKLFLRRTLAGCEFGFCLNLNVKNYNEQFLNDNPYCIIDLDPLLVFTIYVRSIFPVLAIILISVLIYVGSIAKKIAKWFTFPSNVKEAVKTTLSIVVDAFSSNISSLILDKIIGFLETNLDKNINQLELNDPESADIIKTLKNIFSSKESAKIAKKLSDRLGKFKVKPNWDKLFHYFTDPVILMKISVYLMLLIASFIMNYHHKKIAIKFDYKTESEEYLNNPNDENIKNICSRHEKEFTVSNIAQNSEEELSQIDKKVSKSYLYQMTACNIMRLLVDLSDFNFDKKSLIKKGFESCFQKSNKSKYLIVSYTGNKKAFLQQVQIYATIQYPSISKFVGFNNDKKNQYIILDSMAKGTLENYINSTHEKLDETRKLIISYGTARALEYLHKHNIVHRNVQPSNIYLDLDLFPYLSDFYMAKPIEKKLPYNLKQTTIEYMAPEFIENYLLNQDSFKLDVYSFGMTLYFLITETKPFASYCIDSEGKEELRNDILNGKRPEFPKSIPKEWKKLIKNCWKQDQSKRPDFTQICRTLESFQFASNRINSKIFTFYKDEYLNDQKLEARID